MDQKPQFMIIYRCTECQMESGYTELDQPACRYCDKQTKMRLVSKEKLTPEVMAKRLSRLTENMFSNLQSAYENMTEDDKAPLSENDDPEKMMLEILARAKKLKEEVERLDIESSDEALENDDK